MALYSQARKSFLANDRDTLSALPRKRVKVQFPIMLVFLGFGDFFLFLRWTLRVMETNIHRMCKKKARQHRQNAFRTQHSIMKQLFVEDLLML